MKYPMITVFDPWCGEIEREMTPTEYEDRLNWYREYMKKNIECGSRRTVEYACYLKRWFGDGPCDGVDSFKTRYAWHTLPMPFNIYFN